MPKLNADDSGFGPYVSRCQPTVPIGRPSATSSTMSWPFRSERSGPRARASRSVGSRGSPKSLNPPPLVTPGVEQVGVCERGVPQPDARRIRERVVSGSPVRRLGRPAAGALRSVRERAAPRCQGTAADGPLVGEPRGTADPRGDGMPAPSRTRRIRRRAGSARGRQRGRRLGDGPSDAQERRRRAAVDRVRQGGAAAAGRPRDDARARAPRVSQLSGDRVRRDYLATSPAPPTGPSNAINAEAPTDRQHRRPLDPEIEADRLERAFDR